MEPRIQYAKTSDGVSIAYRTMGSGPPLVFLRSENVSHVGLELTVPDLRYFYERLADGRTLIRYDARGCGLSTREVTEFSHEALTRDLLAVLEANSVARTDLFSLNTGSLLALFFATAHPNRVRRVAMLGMAGSENISAFGLLRSIDDDSVERFWSDYVQIQAHLLVGWENGELASRLATIYEQAITPRHLRRVQERDRSFDPERLLQRLTVPTLLLGRGGSLENAARLAAQIPGAQIAVVPAPPGNYILNFDLFADALISFLEEGRESELPAATLPPATAAALATILFTDIADSTALTQRLGDAKAQELVRAHNAIVREALAAHGGSEVKHTGDGIMASFPTASGALECAVAIQRAVEGTRAKGQGPSDLAVHIGLNAGEPVAEERDLFGTSVQLARRICDHAESGQILASNVVRELAAGKGFLFADIGEVVPKGFEEPVRLYEVRWREDA